MIKNILKHKCSDGRLFDNLIDAFEYENSSERISVALNFLGENPDDGYCRKISREILEAAIKLFDKEIQIWFPNVKGYIKYDGIIGRYIDDTERQPDNLKSLWYMLNCINQDTLLMYNQIYAKNHPAANNKIQE